MRSEHNDCHTKLWGGCMSRQTEWTIKGGLIGGLIGVLIGEIFRFIGFLFRFWFIILPLFTYFYVAHKISWWWNDGDKKDAIFASFDKTKVILSNPRGVLINKGGIHAIEFDITN